MPKQIESLAQRRKRVHEALEQYPHGASIKTLQGHPDLKDLHESEIYYSLTTMERNGIAELRWTVVR